MARTEDTKESETAVVLTIPLCIFWTIWKKRNNAYFKNKRAYVYGIKDTGLKIYSFGVKDVIERMDQYIEFLDLLEIFNWCFAVVGVDCL